MSQTHCPHLSWSSWIKNKCSPHACFCFLVCFLPRAWFCCFLSVLTENTDTCQTKQVLKGWFPFTLVLPQSAAPPETRVRGGVVSRRLQLCANHEGPGLHDLETREAPALVRGTAFGASPGIAGRQGAAQGSVPAPRGHTSQPQRGHRHSSVPAHQSGNLRVPLFTFLFPLNL